MLIIPTQRLLIRDYTVDDWQKAHEYCRNEDILKYETWGPNSVEQTKEFANKAYDDSKITPRMTYEMGITLKTNGEWIGGCGFRIDQKREGVGNIGYIVHPNYWNKGIATEAALGLINFVVEQCGITTVEATCDVLNLASKKVLEKCGLVVVRQTDKDIAMKGRMRDTYHFEKKA